MTNVEFTSEAIRSAKFKERLRGYPPEEVDAFLERCATALEQLTDRLGEMNARALRAEAALAGNSEADESVRRTLVLAQRTAEMAVREANDEATQIRAAARTEADRIVTEVKAEAHRVESDAAQRAAAIEQDAEQARASAMEQAAATIDAANITAEATLRDAARQAAALDSEIIDEVTRRRSEIEAEIDGRRAQALQEIEESVSSLRGERERLSLDVSTLGTRLEAERSHVLEALRSATARLDEAFAERTSETSGDEFALHTSSASSGSAEPEVLVDFAASSPSPETVRPSAFVASRETDESSETAETPEPTDTGDGGARDDVAAAPAAPPLVEDGHADLSDVDPSVVDESAELGGVVGGAVDEPVVESTRVEETAGDATFADAMPEHGSSADLTAVGEVVAAEPALDGPSYEHDSFAGETAVAAEPVHDETLYEHDSFAGETAVAAEPVRDETSYGHGSLAEMDEPAADAFAGAPSLEDGAQTPGDAEAPSLTVVDGWASPEASDDPERPVAEAASDPWAWSPEPEVAAEPAATWFPEAVLEDATPDHDHVSAGDAWGAWSDDQVSPRPGPRGDDRAVPPLDPSDPAAGRSTIFQPTAGWASTAHSTPAAEPWSVWGPGAGEGAGQVGAQPSTWKPAWQAEVPSHHPAVAAWESATDHATAPWRRDDPQPGPDPVGPTASIQPPPTVPDPAWGSVWQPPEPVGWGSPSGSEPGAWIPSPREPGSDRETTAGIEPGVGAGIEPGVGAGTDAPGVAGTTAATGPVGTDLGDPRWVPEGEPAPGDLHDPWRDLPQPGVARSQTDDPPPPRLLFTLEEDGRPAEPGGDSSPDAKPRKSLLGRRRF